MSDWVTPEQYAELKRREHDPETIRRAAVTWLVNGREPPAEQRDKIAILTKDAGWRAQVYVQSMGVFHGARADVLAAAMMRMEKDLFSEATWNQAPLPIRMELLGLVRSGLVMSMDEIAAAGAAVSPLLQPRVDSTMNDTIAARLAAMKPSAREHMRRVAASILSVTDQPVVLPPEVQERAAHVLDLSREVNVVSA